MAKVALKPLADRVLVEAAPAEKTTGGIIIRILQRKNHSAAK